MRRVLLLFASCCALWATPGLAAKKPPVFDRISATGAPGEVTLAKLGPALLINIYVPAESHPAPPRVGSSWEVKSVGVDRYGRALVLLIHPGEKTTLQEDWLSQGQAIAYSPAMLPKKFMEAEQEARQARRGVWARLAVLSPATAMDHLQQFALVEGRVTRTFKARDAYYINFGDDWKNDFSITVPRKAWRGFKDELEVTPGSRLRVRGAIISQNGPMIIVTRPEQIERL